MGTKVFLPKQDQRIPDSYGIRVEDITGKTREFKVASHTFIDHLRAMEIITFDNEYVVLPIDNVVIYFDKEFTKLVELKQELNKNNNQPTDNGISADVTEQAEL